MATYERVIEHYDQLLYHPVIKEYYAGTDFSNFGYWEDGVGDAGQASRNLVEKLLAYIPSKSGSILDVACGKGATTAALLEHYDASSVTGTNVSEKQLADARRNAPGCTFVVGDAANLEFEDASFDNVICVEAAFHFYTREKFLADALRVLKPGGRLVLADVLMTLEAQRRMRSFHEENFLPGPEQYRALCQEVGFVDVVIEDATRPCWELHFWDFVRFMHHKFVSHEIDVTELKRYLEVTYRLVSDLTFYLVASLRKP